MSFKRFILRGNEKVETQMGLITMAHNIKKLSLALQKLTYRYKIQQIFTEI